MLHIILILSKCLYVAPVYVFSCVLVRWTRSFTKGVARALRVSSQRTMLWLSDSKRTDNAVTQWLSQRKMLWLSDSKPRTMLWLSDSKPTDHDVTQWL